MNTKNNRNNNKVKRYKVKSKFRFITFIVIVMCMCVGVFGFITGIGDSTALTKPADNQTVEILAGDTLWDIANEFKSDDTDTREAVYEICKLNNIKADDLVPGMILEVPQDL
ncbi:MAG: LysM peptidoglycan-binding domain-containing protein [Firmicutes bacterium]|nr:LysM peptidoglycan-binding domain-containing protein [Bacillota bacterium]